MGKYAAKTSTSVRDSVSELERILDRWGCDNFALMKGEDEHKVGFRFQIGDMAPSMVRVTLPLHCLDDQGIRVAWRALVMVVKAKFAAIDAGITSFDREFMPDLVLADGSTVGQNALPQIEESRTQGRLARSFDIAPTKLLENHS